MTIYRGEHTYIRPITYDDTDLIVKWRNQDNISRYFFYREHFTKEIHENWMRTKVETGQVVQFVVCLNDGDAPIGSTYLRDVDIESGTAEYGVFIGDESIRGRGIGKEILSLTLKYAWDELGLKRIMARAISTNDASINSKYKNPTKPEYFARHAVCALEFWVFSNQLAKPFIKRYVTIPATPEINVFNLISDGNINITRKTNTKVDIGHKNLYFDKFSNGRSILEIQQTSFLFVK